MLRDLKANSSGWMDDVFPEIRDFSWQNGRGAFTVSASQIPKVQKYIREFITLRNPFVMSLLVCWSQIRSNSTRSIFGSETEFRFHLQSAIADGRIKPRVQTRGNRQSDFIQLAYASESGLEWNGSVAIYDSSHIILARTPCSRTGLYADAIFDGCGNKIARLNQTSA